MAPRLILVAALLCLTLTAQMKMTVEQLRAFVKSSRQLGHADRKVAEYVKQIRLTERLDDAAVEDLQGMGAGPKTLEALKILRDASKGLSAPAPPPPKPVVAQIPPPDSIEQKKILQEITDYAREYSRKLPNFICTQVTRRSDDPSGLEFWRRLDTVTARLSYFEQKEDYKVVLINNQMVNTSIDKIGGSTSSGEFGSLMSGIFEPASRAEFDWERWATLRGHRMHVFTYRVPQAYSKWRIVYERSQAITPGYHGLIYVDRDTLAVMRITLEADDIPVTFPVQSAKTTLDYDFVDIAGQEFVLPLKASVTMRSGKYLVKNDSEFRLYKKFGAEATITYTPDPLPEEQIKEK